MSDVRRLFVTCTPIACLLLLTAGWKLATLEPPRPPTVLVDDPVGRAEALYRDARKFRESDPATARALCDEAIATLDSLRDTTAEPAPGQTYAFEELHQRLVELKIVCR